MLIEFLFCLVHTLKRLKSVSNHISRGHEKDKLSFANYSKNQSNERIEYSFYMLVKDFLKVPLNTDHVKSLVSDIFV